MKTRVYIIALLSIAAVAMNAQTFQPATIDNSAIQSQKIMQTGTNYSGQVYEPFSSVTPSEQSAVGASYSSKSKSGPRRSKENPTDPGITDDNNSPIGDALLPLLLMAVAFGIYSAARRKRLTAKQ